MSVSNPLTMTEFDVRRLDALFERLRLHVKPPPTLTLLERELERAVVVKPDEVPATVVTMNSEVEVVDLDTGERRSLKLEVSRYGRAPPRPAAARWRRP